MGSLDALELSPRATEWLASLGVTRFRPAFDPATATAVLARAGLGWAAALEAEARFGGLWGQPTDGREFWLGLLGPHEPPDAGPRRLAIGGRPQVVLGWYGPIALCLDEAGRVTELDELGHTFYVADSLATRIEQLALDLWAVHEHREAIAGRVGRRLAEALGLERLEEPGDRRQSFWATPGLTSSSRRGVMVVESEEPVAYGAAELHGLTYVSAGSPGELARALAAAGPRT